MRNQPYQAWSPSVYEAVSLDAYSTDCRLAEQPIALHENEVTSQFGR
jgi:hypothetical protein